MEMNGTFLITYLRNVSNRRRFSQVNEVFFYSGAVVTALMFVVWLVSLRLQNASIIDLVWGFGFVLIAWTVFIYQGSYSITSFLLPCLTTIWGLRLSVYLAWRNHRKPEDYRYQEMREKWREKFPLVSLLTVFCMQGIVMWLVSLPVQYGIAVADYQSKRLSITTLGVTIWAVGLFFETIGDWQLSKFRGNRCDRNAVLDTGLWRYTRHPNYFGDFLVWWGLFIVSISLGAAWWTILGPVIMSVFLLRISGVSLLEKNLTANKPGYAEYIQRTNAFFPWLPR